MRIITNTSRLKRGRFIATTFSVAGLLMLITATIASFMPRYGLASFPVLLFGIIFSMIGIRYSRQWTQPPLAHEALALALKGIGKEAVLINYWPSAPHILITPGGVYSLTTRLEPYDLTVDGDNWTDHASGYEQFRRRIAQKGLGNPIGDARRDARGASTWLTKLLGASVAAQPLIVFLNPKTQLEVREQPAVPVAYADKRTPSLKTLLKQPSAQTLSPHQVEQLVTTLEASGQA